MTESEFWPRLEYRVCHEMRGDETCRREGLWCDGFLPARYEFNASEPTISGTVWIGRGPREQEPWQFTLWLPEGHIDRDQIPWAELVPEDDVTDWLGLHLSERRLEVRPADATPDGPPV